jgi:hypothetical protein
MRLSLLAFAALTAAVPASAAERTYSVTQFTRVRVDGGYSVTLTSGSSPYARATGSPAALDAVSVDVQGETLIVRRNPSAWGGYPGERPGPVELSVGTHDVTSGWVNGDGALAIDKVTGQSFQLSVEGAGSASVDALAVDKLQADLRGSGSIKVGGRAAIVRLGVNGPGSIDAAGLSAKDAHVEAAGNAVVTLTATNTAELRTAGNASVDLSGRPACTVHASGSSSVSGCR